MKEKLQIIIVLVGLLLSFLFIPARAKEPSPESIKELTAAYTKFSFNLFNKLIKDNHDQNIFVSPLSMAFGLAVAYNGAAAETKQAIGRTLEIQGINPEALNQGNARLRRSLQNLDEKNKSYMADPLWRQKWGNPGETKLYMAESLWLNQGQEFKPEFLKINEEFYGVAAEVLDFHNPKTLATINDWVAKATAGKITQIVKEIKPPILLINTLYLKAPWILPFREKETKEQPFSLLNGKRKQVMMMTSHRVKYEYYRGKNFQAVSIPCGMLGAGSRISMKVFLPDKNSSLKKFCQQLNEANWQSWLANLQFIHGTIKLPRFKLEYEAPLKEPLKALGMEIAFDQGQANFDNLSATRVYVEDVRQKTFLEVNEKGIEAGAANVTMLPMSAPIKEFKMVVDRPFFVAIDDCETGALLFMGAIFEPKQ